MIFRIHPGNRRPIQWVTILVVIFVALFGCGKKDDVAEQPPAPVEEAVVEEEELEAIQVQEFDHALVTFISGDVFIQDGEEWVWVNIGEALQKDTILKTEDGYAELQFGQIGTLRVQENTTIRVADVRLKPGESKASVELVAGQVLNKVERLAAGENYQVRTQTAVMGVRGTEFGVSVGAAQETKLAVREGAVGVLPSTVDTEAMAARAATSVAGTKAAEAAIRAIEEVTPVVSANQEIVVDQEKVRETAEAIREVEAKVDEVVASGAEDVEEAVVEEIAQVAREKVQEATQTAVEPAREISEESRQELEEIENIRVVKVPVPQEPTEPAEGEEAEGEAAEEAEPAPPPPALVPIAINAEPADAEILMDGRVIGRGSFSGVFLQGESVNFTVRKEGFFAKELPVEITQARGRSISVKLNAVPAPEPEPVEEARVDVRVDPNDAEIFINGEPVGTRRFRDDFPVDSELTISATADGYEPVEQILTVASGRNNIELTLERSMGTLAVSVQPTDADILVDGDRVAAGSFNESYPTGTELEVSVEREFYEPASRTITITKETDPLDIELVRKIARLSVSSTPSAAAIFIDGDRSGTGSASQELPVGESVSLRVEAENYVTFSDTVTIEEGMSPVAVSLDRQMAQVSINVSPADAAIYLDGEQVGTGSYRGTAPVGDSYQVRLAKPGFAELTVPLVVSSGVNSLEYSLSQDMGTLNVTAQPRDAEILINGAVVGTGSIQQTLPAGQDVSVQVRRDNYLSQERELSIQKGANSLRFNLEREMARVTLTVQPSQAAVTINGRSVGTGSFNGEYAAGETLRVQVQSPGYEAQTINLPVGSVPVRRTISLEARPIEQRVRVSSAPLVRSVAVVGDSIIAADADGGLSAISTSGRQLWDTATGNSANENSAPVVAGSRVVFSGAAELVVVDAARGTVAGRTTLSGEESHLFGRSVLYAGGSIYLPTDNGLEVLSADGSSRTGSIAVDGGSKMSVAMAGGNRLVIADQQGVIRVINAASGAELSAIPTGASQPVALAPAVDGNRVFFAGRRGTAVAVDIGANTVVWEAALPSGVFVDPVVGDRAVYYFARGSIIALDKNTGNQLFELSGAASRPAYHDGVLYAGFTDGTVRVLNATTGAVQKRLRVGAAVTAGPAFVDDRFAVGLENGEVVLIHPAGIQ